jgi:hypothetical protein
MRRLIAALVLGAAVLGQADPGRASPGGDVGLAFAAAAIDVLYIPAKLAVAAGGLVVGGVIGTLTGGDTRAAYALWVPAAGGTFMVTPDHLDGTEPLEFFGSDYSDRPSGMGEGTTFYDAAYSSR